MDGLASFLDMGGYAAFVWPAYGVAAAVLVTLLLEARRALARSRRALALLEAAAGRRRPDRSYQGEVS
jgi:heme exporter protein D